MISYQTILVPTDFSPCAEKALEYAVDFARKYDSEVVLFHAVEPIETYTTVSGLEQAAFVDLVKEVQESSKKVLEERISTLQNSGVKARYVVAVERSADAIIDFSKEHNISMICMATHGRGGLSHFLLGSTTEKVLRKSTCPVFVIRSEAE